MSIIDYKKVSISTSSHLCLAVFMGENVLFLLNRLEELPESENLDFVGQYARTAFHYAQLHLTEINNK